MSINFRKMINCRTLDRITITFLILLLSLIMLSAVRFSIQAFYPAPFWNDYCLSSCNDRDEMKARHDRIIYQDNLQIILYVFAIVSLIISVVIQKARVAHYTLISFGFFTLAFAFFSAPEQNWYIEFGLEPSVFRSLVGALAFFSIGYLVFVRIDEIHTKMLHDENFTCNLIFKKPYKKYWSKVRKKFLKK